MNGRKLIAGFTAIILAVCICTNTLARDDSPGSAVSPDQVHGDNYRVERAYLVSIHVPNGDVDRVLKAVVNTIGLEYGKYDQVAYLDAPGIEQFRSRSGSKSGAESSAERVPTTNVSFSIPWDDTKLRKAIDAAYRAHSYEEPVIYIREIWRTREIGRASCRERVYSSV